MFSMWIIHIITKELSMVIRRKRKHFIVTDINTVLEEFGTFECAREYLADHGVEDAMGELCSHSNVVKDEEEPIYYEGLHLVKYKQEAA